MNEPVNIAQLESIALCPACKRRLLTRSARLCSFCGEKLPERLLLPLAEVHRQEQQSLDTVERVIAAYEVREAEIIERSRHITHAGVLFDDQVRDTLFPEVGSNEWALHEFSRTLRLPDDKFDGRARKKELDERIHKLCSKLASNFGRLNCKLERNQAGHLSAKLSDHAISLVIETQFGQNATFAGGVSHPFLSYAIRAEARVLTLNKVDGTTQRLRLACMIAGILGVPAGFVWLVYTIARAWGLEMYHQLWLHETGVTLALLAGAWLGGKAGQALATSIERRTMRRAEADGTLPRAESLWDALMLDVGELTKEFEVV